MNAYLLSFKKKRGINRLIIHSDQVGQSQEISKDLVITKNIETKNKNKNRN